MHTFQTAWAHIDRHTSKRWVPVALITLLTDRQMFAIKKEPTSKFATCCHANKCSSDAECLRGSSQKTKISVCLIRLMSEYWTTPLFSLLARVNQPISSTQESTRLKICLCSSSSSSTDENVWKRNLIKHVAKMASCEHLPSMFSYLFHFTARFGCSCFPVRVLLRPH